MAHQVALGKKQIGRRVLKDHDDDDDDDDDDYNDDDDDDILRPDREKCTDDNLKTP